MELGGGKILTDPRNRERTYSCETENSNKENTRSKRLPSDSSWVGQTVRMDPSQISHPCFLLF